MDLVSQDYDTSEDRPPPSAGQRFYSPGVIAAYCILANIPLAVFLYGINVCRRGNVRSGNAIKIVAALAIVTMTIAFAIDARLSGIRFMLPGLVIGIGLFKAEKAYYGQAVAKGASPEKWWPPALIVVANAIVLILIDYIFDPE